MENIIHGVSPDFINDSRFIIPELIFFRWKRDLRVLYIPTLTNPLPQFFKIMTFFQRSTFQDKNFHLVFSPTEL